MRGVAAFAETETSTRPYAIAAMESTAPEVWYEPTEEEEAAGKGPAPAKAGIMDYIYSHLHTHADVKGSYNDNIYLVNRPKTGDFVTTVKPGVSYRIGDKLPTAGGKLRSYFEADAGYKIDYYMANSREFNNPYVTVALRGTGNHYLVEGDYSFTKDILTRQVVQAGSQGILGVTRQRANLRFKYDWDRIGVETSYRLYQIEYPEVFEIPSSIRDSAVRGLIWVRPSFTPKTRFYFEYDYGLYEYYKEPVNYSNNFKYHQIWVGAKGNFTKKFSGDVKIGREFRFSYANIGKYKDGFIIRINLQYRYTQKLRFALNAAQENRPATFRGQGLDSEYRFYLYTIYSFNPRLVATGGLSYVYDSYTTDRMDNTYGASARLDYLVNKWTTVGIEYIFKTRQSERAGGKYNNSVITGRLGMAF